MLIRSIVADWLQVQDNLQIAYAVHHDARKAVTQRGQFVRAEAEQAIPVLERAALACGRGAVAIALPANDATFAAA